MINAFNLSFLYYLIDLQLNWLFHLTFNSLILIPIFCFNKAFECFFPDY